MSARPSRPGAATSRAALDALPANVALLDRNGVIVWVNRRWLRFGAANGLDDPAGALGRSYLEICAAAEASIPEAAAAAEGVRAVLARQLEELSIDYAAHGPEVERWFRLVARPLNAGPRSGAVVIHSDVTETKLAERSARIFRAAVEAASDMVIVADVDGRIEYVNPAFTLGSGLEPAEAAGRDLVSIAGLEGELEAAVADALRRGVSWRAEVVRQRPDGLRYWQDVAVLPVHDDDGRVARFIAIERDITQPRSIEELLRSVALHDALTGLPNRLLLTDRIERGLLRLARTGKRLAVLSIDLDGFGPINDTWGHAAGDWLLAGIANRMRTIVRAGDTASRTGGDEFVVLLEDLSSTAEAEAVARRLLAALQQPVQLGAADLQISASIGVAIATSSRAGVQPLLQAADAALAEAKALGPGRYVINQSS